MVKSFILIEEIYGLNEVEKSKFEALLEDFKGVFALTNKNLGCDQDELYKMDASEAELISQSSTDVHQRRTM